MAYLFFCSLALLLRHLPRHRESIITIPIMATPSFMPSQMESNGSTVHLSQRVRRHFASDAQSPVEHLHHECRFGKKRWYLAVSVNGRLAAVEDLRIQRYSRSRSGDRAFPRRESLDRALFTASVVTLIKRSYYHVYGYRIVHYTVRFDTG